LNDEGVAAVRGAAVAGWVRLGLSHDFSDGLLPLLLGGFARAYPKVRVEARVDPVDLLVGRIIDGSLALSLAGGEEATPSAPRVAKSRAAWVGTGRGFCHSDGEVRLVAFESPCVFRDPAVAALDAAGVPWRLAFSSPSLAALYAAVEAGLGVT